MDSKRTTRKLPGWQKQICHLFLLCLALQFSQPALARDSSVICENAARDASNKTGVPFSVLMAITLTETGKKQGGSHRPWPWTVNMEGEGVWFQSPDDARAYVYKHYKRGARSFDVGCFQLNYKWHHHSFASIEEMFEPGANALYAANFLLDLFKQKGNWLDAAGAYHSKTPKYANSYKKKFSEYWTVLAKDVAPVRSIPVPVAQVETASAGPKPVNSYPLLIGNLQASSSLGSLVPLGEDGAARRRLISR